MDAQNSAKALPPQQAKKKTKSRLIKWLLLAAFVLIMAVVLIIPVYVSSERGRKTILTKINDSIDGRADFADLSMGWLKGISITDLKFSDSSGRTKVRVKQISAKPRYASILMGSLSLGKTVIDEPRIEISLTPAQPQVSRPAVPATSPPERTKPVALPVRRVDLFVNNGSIRITDSRARTVEVSAINSHIDLRPPGERTNLDISMVLVAEGKQSKLSAAGQITPKKETGWSLEGASGRLGVEVNDLDIGSLGPLFALAGMDIRANGNISANLKSQITNGRLENLSCVITGTDLDIDVPGLETDRLRTSTLDVTVELAADEQLINIKRLNIQTDWLKADAAGVVPRTLKSMGQFLSADSAYGLQADFTCDLAAAASQMPGTFGLRQGTRITSGRLTGSVKTSTGPGRRKITGTANLADLRGEVQGRAVTLAQPVTADVEITSDQAGINFDKLQLSSSFAEINCAGNAQLLKYSANVDLTELQNQLGQFVDMGRYQIAGKFESAGEISSGKDKITVAGSAVFSNLRLSSAARGSVFEPKADISFAFDIDRKNNIVSVDSFEADASFGSVSVKDAAVPLNEEAKKPLYLPVTANIDLQKLRPYLVVFASLPNQMQLFGVAESGFSVTSKKDTYRITTEATKIRNLRLIYPQREPFEQQEISLVADVKFNPAEKTYAAEWQLFSPQIKIEGDIEKVAEGSDSKLQGRANCEYDWAVVSEMASAFLPPGLKMAGRRKDTVTFSSRYPADQPDKFLANLNTRAKLGFEKAEYMGLDFGPTEVDVQVQKGLLIIAPFSTTVNQGRLNFAGRADFNRQPVLLKTPGPIEIVKDIQINDETTGKLLMYVNPIFANTVDVSGVANFNCEKLAIPLAGASQNDIEVVGTFSINRLRLQSSGLLGQILSAIGAGVAGQDITIHPTKFVLRNGFLKYDDMQIDIGEHPVNFKGVIGLDKSLDMSVTLPYTSRGRTVRIGRETPADRVTLKLKGTLDKPELDVADLLGRELLGDRIKEELGEEVGEKALEILDELFK